MHRLNRILTSSYYMSCLCVVSRGGGQVAAFVGGNTLVTHRLDHKSWCPSRPCLRMVSNSVDDSKTHLGKDDNDDGKDGLWKKILPFVDSSHNSCTITVPDNVDDNFLFHRTTFPTILGNTVTALRGMKKSSLWVEVPMSRAGLIECTVELGFEYHHAEGKTAKLNLWLREDLPSMVPEFATHHLGVGSVVINSRNEILCIRELRRNYVPWKVPTGLSERGESIAEAAEREVLEETGIHATFHSILSFRHTHGMAHGRSDIFFVCRLVPIEQDGEIKAPVPQESEIAEARWLPLSEYRAMIDGTNGQNGHPMMSFVMNQIFDTGIRIETQEVKSLIPGKAPTEMYYPVPPTSKLTFWSQDS